MEENAVNQKANATPNPEWQNPALPSAIPIRSAVSDAVCVNQTPTRATAEPSSYVVAAMSNVPVVKSFLATLSDENESSSTTDDNGRKDQGDNDERPVEVIEDPAAEWSSDSEDVVITAAKVKQLQQGEAVGGGVKNVPKTAHEVVVPQDVRFDGVLCELLETRDCFENGLYVVSKD